MEKFKEIDWNYCKRWAQLCNFGAWTNEYSYLHLWRDNYSATIFAYEDTAYVNLKIKAYNSLSMHFDSMLFNIPLAWRDTSKVKLWIALNPFTGELTEEIYFKAQSVKHFDELDVIKIIEFLDKKIPK
ncbi:MAG: hypothetical protein DRJ03_25545 [Chloroflexi bacterium]|nr:MAG: hypothetical protein DRJ03_25545 [Chloroflexota bacterium]